MVEGVLLQVGSQLSLLRAGQAGRLVLELRSEGRDPRCGLLTPRAGGEERGPGLGAAGRGGAGDAGGLSLGLGLGRGLGAFLLVTAGVSDRDHWGGAEHDGSGAGGRLLLLLEKTFYLRLGYFNLCLTLWSFTGGAGGCC